MSNCIDCRTETMPICINYIFMYLFVISDEICMYVCFVSYDTVNKYYTIF